MRNALDILARLLSDPGLRSRYVADPAATLQLLNADQEAMRTLQQLDAAQLEHQARGLLSKRWSEVRALLPRTIAAIGAEAYGHFRQFATGSWPAVTDRHAADAWAFSHWLSARGLPVNPAERRMLTVRTYRCAFALGWDKETVAWHLCWRGREGHPRQGWWALRLWYAPALSGGPHVPLPDPRRS